MYILIYIHTQRTLVCLAKQCTDAELIQRIYIYIDREHALQCLAKQCIDAELIQHIYTLTHTENTRFNA
jgi:hypothetical protein